jgi:hypothetical protein
VLGGMTGCMHDIEPNSPDLDGVSIVKTRVRKAILPVRSALIRKQQLAPVSAASSRAPLR